MPTNKHWTHYLFVAYIGLLVWLPLPMASSPSWATSFFNMAIAALSLLTVIGLYRHRHPLPAAWRCARVPLISLALFCTWVLVQILADMSINSYRSQRQWLLSLSYLQWFALALILVDTRERLRLLLYVLAACGVFQALYGGLMTLSGMEKIWWISKRDHLGVATGTFTNRNQLANYLVMCLAAGCALLIASQQGRSIGSWRQLLRRLVEWLLSGSGWLRLLLAAIVIGIVLTHSRMGNASLFISLTATGLVWMWRTRLPRKHAMILIGSLLAVDTLIVGTWFGLEEVLERMQDTKVAHTETWLLDDGGGGDTMPAPTPAPRPAGNSATPSKNSLTDNELRDTALPNLLAMARDHWLTGVGLGNFSTGFTEYKTVKTRKFYNEAHFDGLQFLIETGVIGLTLLVITVLSCVWQGWLALLHCRSRLLQGTGFAATMSSTAGLLHSWVEYNFQMPATASLFLLMLALGIIARSLPDKKADDGTGSRQRNAAAHPGTSTLQTPTA